MWLKRQSQHQVQKENEKKNERHNKVEDTVGMDEDIIFVWSHTIGLAPPADSSAYHQWLQWPSLVRCFCVELMEHLRST